jgi:hypothetical protein
VIDTPLECSRQAASKYAEIRRSTCNPSGVHFLREDPRSSAALRSWLSQCGFFCGGWRCCPSHAALLPPVRRALPRSRARQTIILVTAPCLAAGRPHAGSTEGLCASVRQMLIGSTAAQWPQQGHAACAARKRGATARRQTNTATSTSRRASLPSTSSRSGRGQPPRPQVVRPRQACPTGGSCSRSRPSSTAGMTRAPKPARARATPPRH